MSDLVTRRIVHCPTMQAGRRLKQFFLERGSSDGRNVRLVLEAPFAPAGSRTAATLAKPVAAVFTNVPTNDRFPLYLIQWKPSDGGPYPTFSGHLSVEPDEDYDSFLLKLKGDYEAPFGIAGGVFDMAIGRRIAKSTMQTLLATIAESVERNFQADERLKPTFAANGSRG